MICDVSPQMRAFIEERCQASYAKAKEVNLYTVGRDFKTYLKYLPPFEEIALDQWLMAKQMRNKPATLLDVGCGAGIVLDDIEAKFTLVKAYGLTAYPYRNHFNAKPLPQEQYKIGDIQQVDALYPQDCFDFITSVHVLRYLGDPYDAISRLYQLLKPGGIMFLHDPQVFINHWQKEALENYWRSLGIKADLVKTFSEIHSPSGDSLDPAYACSYSLAVQKQEAKSFPWPFSYIRISGYDAPRLLYEFDKSKIKEPALVAN